MDIKTSIKLQEMGKICSTELLCKLMNWHLRPVPNCQSMLLQSLLFPGKFVKKVHSNWRLFERENHEKTSKPVQIALGTLFYPQMYRILCLIDVYHFDSLIFLSALTLRECEDRWQGYKGQTEGPLVMAMCPIHLGRLTEKEKY